MYKLFCLITLLRFVTASAAPYKYYLSWDSFSVPVEHYNKIGVVYFDSYGDNYKGFLGLAHINWLNPLMNRVEIDLHRIYRSGIHPNFIVVHEYGHLVYLEHPIVNTYLSDGCTDNLMNSRFSKWDSSVECWHRHKEHYFEQIERWKTCTHDTCDMFSRPKWLGGK